jgi:DNA helicase-2/ATP-dependent DNA helicase PcrA
MSRNPALVQAAIAKQQAAALDPSTQVLLIAGPGSGKSATIEQRVVHLIQSGVPASSIAAISFTNASARDLRARIDDSLSKAGLTGNAPQVSTLHSFALRGLNKANLIGSYPVSPLVLGKWEIRHLIDDEFAEKFGVSAPRAIEIREHYETLVATAQPVPVQYRAPTTPVTKDEAAAFRAFLGPRKTLYACVLPGEIVREAVTHSHSGLLDVAETTGVTHLIVDEFQDLNPVDIQFVDLLLGKGIRALVCGDDDQSIYAFRYGSPAGMREFTNKYPNCAEHTLDGCFRSTPAVLAAALALIGSNADTGRIAKRHQSLYTGAQPPVDGTVGRWIFTSARSEAVAIAQSCATLIGAGLPPREILILIANRGLQTPDIYRALDEHGVPYVRDKDESILDQPDGMRIVNCLRYICSKDDYVAQRSLLGLKPGVGDKTLVRIADAAIANSVSTTDLFQGNLPPGVFGRRETSALESLGVLLAALNAEPADGNVDELQESIVPPLNNFTGTDHADALTELLQQLPGEATVNEALDFLRADMDEQQSRVLCDILGRLGREFSEDELLPAKVRVMSMHGAKGLSSSAVFIPGLEDGVIPNAHSCGSAGGGLEAARLLYVSVTRAKNVAVLSFAHYRQVYGRNEKRNPSRFCRDLGGRFEPREAGLTDVEVAQIMNDQRLL